MSSAPSGSRVEHLDSALGIRTTAPRLSWRLPAGARAQTGYRVTTDNGWNSGRVESDQNLLVPYAGPPLGSSQRVEWRVQVRTDLGESPVSERCRFETGLLWAEDWRASCIEPGAMPDGERGARPAALLRFGSDVERPVVAARLHATAHGQTGITRADRQWGDRLAVLAQLHLVHEDGEVTGPRPGGGLSSAEAAHESPYGRIESAWRVHGGTFSLRVVVPPGTEAEVVLPDGTTHRAAPGEHTYTSTLEDRAP